MLHVATLLREHGFVLSERRGTTYIFKIIIDFFQRKKLLKLFGQGLPRSSRLGKAHREFFRIPVGYSVSIIKLPV